MTNQEIYENKKVPGIRVTFTFVVDIATEDEDKALKIAWSNFFADCGVASTEIERIMVNPDEI